MFGTTNEEDVEEETEVEICSVGSHARPNGEHADEFKEQSAEVRAIEEKNPFFSHSMEVNEEEFNFRLKREQNIRVDFNQFPTHFIDLLRECLAGGENDWDRRRRRRREKEEDGRR